MKELKKLFAARDDEYKLRNESDAFKHASFLVFIRQHFLQNKEELYEKNLYRIVAVI